MSDLRVRDAMHQGAVSCDVNTPIGEAIKLMESAGVRSLVVTRDQTTLCGFVSQSDLVNASLNSTNANWKSAPVNSIMKRKVTTVMPETLLQDAAKKMINNHIHRLVVVTEEDQSRAIGVLSMGDVMHHLAGTE